MDLVVGLDLGTTNCKALALTEDGQVAASAAIPTPSLRERSPGGAEPVPEYDAEELWQCSSRLIRQVVGGLAPHSRAAAVAVASMGEAGVLLDAADQPLAPIMTWFDPRTKPWRDWWRQRLDEAELFQMTGLAPRHVFSANKLMWYRENAPSLYARAATWLSLADWITFRLTGQRVTTYSMASRTMLFDLRERTWSEALLHLTSLPSYLLPPPLPSGRIVGGLSADGARMTGLPVGTPIVTGGHDHACAAFGAGVVQPGPLLNSSGTVDVIFGSLDAPLREIGPAAGISCGCHAARDRYYLMGGVLSGAVVDWMSSALEGDNAPSTIKRLMDTADASPMGANGTRFESSIDRDRLDDVGPAAWDAWLRDRQSADRGDLVRAVMEGLSFGIRGLVDQVQAAGRVSPKELRAVGGGTRNTWWQSLKADVLGLAIKTPAAADVAAVGAAMLAGIGVGLFPDETQAIARAYRVSTTYETDEIRHAYYDKAYRETKNLGASTDGLPLNSKRRDPSAVNPMEQV